MSLYDFEIGKELGKGAFGAVYIVVRKQDNKTYAMKRVKISMLSAKERENSLNEIRILASLSHVNIIGYKEAFFDEPSKTLNIVMEYADDGDISSKIKHNLKNGLLFRESVIWDYLIQIINGLHYLHDNKIIHRDLKSANIFLTKEGTLKIGDLNVSKIAKKGLAFTQTGTPYFASPEIWQGKPYDYKSDIWGMGCIIYEMCQLRTPFRGKSFKDLSTNILKGKYPPISKFYSKDLAKVIEMILKVEPKSRPSCEQLLKCDIIKKKMKEVQMENKAIINGNNGVDNEKANLIKTIKMPKNFKEINMALPMKRYNNRQREEMLENDEYETQKNGFFHKEEGDRELNEVLDFFKVNEDYHIGNYNNKKVIYDDNAYNNIHNKIAYNNQKDHLNNHLNAHKHHHYLRDNIHDENNQINNNQPKNNKALNQNHSSNNVIHKKHSHNKYNHYNQVIMNNNNNIIGRNIKKINNIKSKDNKRPVSSINPSRRQNGDGIKKVQHQHQNQQQNQINNNNCRVLRVQANNNINARPKHRPNTVNNQINKKNLLYYNGKAILPINQEYKNQREFKLRNGNNVIGNARNNAPYSINQYQYKRQVKKKIIEKINYQRGEKKIPSKIDKAREYEKQRKQFLVQNNNNNNNYNKKQYRQYVQRGVQV